MATLTGWAAADPQAYRRGWDAASVVGDPDARVPRPPYPLGTSRNAWLHGYDDRMVALSGEQR